MDAAAKSGSMSLRCDHILASLSDASAGPTYSVSALAGALARGRFETSILTLAGWRGDDAPPLVSGVGIHAYPVATSPLLRQIAASPALRKALQDRRTTTDIFHTHGLWLMPNVYPADAARSGSARVVHSPRGMLGADALRFSSLKKQAFMLAFQRRALRSAHCIHATAHSEYREVRAAGFANPVAVIPNGMDLPDLAGRTPKATAARTLLSLGRLHPKKGLDRLIAAWTGIQAEFPDWRLRIVGRDEHGYSDELRRLAHGLGAQRVDVEPPLHGADKSAAFHDAELFVLPSLNENFAMTVAEALAHGVPVISSKGAPWSGLVTNDCGWWVDGDTETLRATLKLALARPAEQLAAMGARGRAWMAADYSWAHVGQQMTDVYLWLLGKGERPATVELA